MKSGEGIYMFKKAVVFLTIVLSIFTLCSCDNEVGFWEVNQIVAGGITMDEEDIDDMGLTSAGSICLKKSGNCKMEFLGEKHEGTWSEEKDGSITITYDDDHTGTATIDKDGVMTYNDGEGAEYKLTK